VAALSVACVGVAVAQSGDDAQGGTAPGPGLAWEERPQLIRPAELPDDRILAGRLHNGTLRELRLDAGEARLVDADGRRVAGTVSFAAGFVHGLYSPRRAPKEAMPEFERRRLGTLAVLRAGDTVPLTLSWRLRDGARAPVRLELGTLGLALPAASP
jgi:hypothetical protein